MILDRLGQRSRTHIKKKLARLLHTALGAVRTLRFKLFLSYILISIIPMFIFGHIVADATEQQLISQKKVDLRSFTTEVVVHVNSQNYMEDLAIRPEVNSHFDNISATQQTRIIIVDNMAMSLYDSLHGSPEAEGVLRAYPDILQALSGNIIERIDESSYIHISMPILNADAEVLGAVMMIYHMTEAYDLVSTINALSITLSLILSCIVALFVFLNSQWLLSPLRHILSAVKNISEGHLHHRVNLSGNDEFSVLGAAFNDMTEKLMQVDSARQEFVSNVSHELKTPLSSIKVLSESLLHQGDIDGEYREFLEDINSEIDRMSDIINELLTLVRLDEVELPLNIENFSINGLIEEIIRRLSPLAAQKGIEIALSELRKVQIDADEMKMTLALSNLIENAIKYNNEGGYIKVTIDADNKSCFITIADTGIGIDDEEQKKVFNRFYRVDKGRDAETGGTGLGLSITQKTVLLHKGHIKLSSKKDEGSTFVVRIPIHRKT